MRYFSRAATIAAVTFSTVFGTAFSAPSFAETVTNAVSGISNVQEVTPVPALEPLPVQPVLQPDIESAPVEAAAPKPKPVNLAQLVSQQIIPDSIDRETECLAASVYFESKSEPLEGQLAVAEVVINRAESGGRFPPSICKVVFQKGQFSFVRGGGYPPIPKASRDWREAVAIAQIALNEAWESRASKAMFFHARRVSPNWNKVRVAQVGNHVFYR
jgi:N-acetylmuramoyl-L-alanine amidase